MNQHKCLRLPALRGIRRVRDDRGKIPTLTTVFLNDCFLGLNVRCPCRRDTILNVFRKTVFLSNPAGIEIPGRPAKFAGTVKISLRYIETGSLVFSPILNAELDVVWRKYA